MAFETNLFTPVLGGLTPISPIGGTASDDSKNPDVGIYKNPAGDPFQAVTWIDGSTVSLVQFGSDTELDAILAATNEVATNALLDSEPKIAVTTQGDIYVTYVRDNNVTAGLGDEEIVIKKYSGGTQDTSFGGTGEVVVAAAFTGGSFVQTPDIAVFDDDPGAGTVAFAVAWSEDDVAGETDFDVFLRTYNADGVELSTEAVLVAGLEGTTDGFNQFDPAIAARPGSPGTEDFALAVSWTAEDPDAPTPFEDNVGLKRFNRANTPFELGGGQLDISFFQGDSAVDIAADGNTVITYTQGEVAIGSITAANGSIIYQLSDALGLPTTAGTIANGVNSSVAMAPTGEFFIAFDDGNGSFYQEFDMDGDPVRGIQSAGVGTNPSAAVTRNLDGKAQDFAAIASEGSVQTQLLAQDLTGADFNMDGTVPAPDRQADIVWRNATTGVNSVWTLNPANLQREDNLLLKAENTEAFEIVGVGDWTGGGINDDLLWRNGDTGELSVWDQDGVLFNNSIVLDAADQELNLQWKVRAVGDMDGDGIRDDIVWQYVGSDPANLGQISIWLMDGAEVDAKKVVQGKTEGNTNWELTGAGQFDGAARDELIFHNIGATDPSRGQISAWLLNFDQATQDFSFASSQLFDKSEGNVGTSDERQWRMTGVADFDGQGTGDFLWRNFQTGANSIWLTEETNPLQLDIIVATNTEPTEAWVSIA